MEGKASADVALVNNDVGKENGKTQLVGEYTYEKSSFWCCEGHGGLPQGICMDPEDNE